MELENTYHIGVYPGLTAGLDRDVLVLEARRHLDLLETYRFGYRYLGEVDTSRRDLRRNARRILASVNAQFGTTFKDIVFD